MPQAFEDCITKGGKVRTKTLKNGKYIKMCFLNGKSYVGEVHTPRTVNQKVRR